MNGFDSCVRPKGRVCETISRIKVRKTSRSSREGSIISSHFIIRSLRGTGSDRILNSHSEQIKKSITGLSDEKLGIVFYSFRIKSFRVGVSVYGLFESVPTGVDSLTIVAVLKRLPDSNPKPWSSTNGCYPFYLLSEILRCLNRLFV